MTEIIVGRKKKKGGGWGHDEAASIREPFNVRNQPFAWIGTGTDVCIDGQLKQRPADGGYLSSHFAAWTSCLPCHYRPRAAQSLLSC